MCVQITILFINCTHTLNYDCKVLIFFFFIKEAGFHFFFRFIFFNSNFSFQNEFITCVRMLNYTGYSRSHYYYQKKRKKIHVNNYIFNSTNESSNIFSFVLLMEFIIKCIYNRVETTALPSPGVRDYRSYNEKTRLEPIHLYELVCVCVRTCFNCFKISSTLFSL